ncbi:MAG TPA: nuclear transport factor 2 family protein [Actinokineospora sp.]|nr:nuclear transport factor 2 family protein [Actinokineospora sp.]
MSAENVALVRSVYDNFANGDIPAVLGVLSPEIEWVETDSADLPHRGTHIGPQAVAEKVFGMVMANFDEFAVVPETLLDAGADVVVQGRAVGITKSGRKLDAPAAWVWTVEDGKAVRNVNYHDTQAWVSALNG